MGRLAIIQSIYFFNRFKIKKRDFGTEKSIKNCLTWFCGQNTSEMLDQYCPTRDVFEGRLSKIPAYLQKNAKFDEGEAFLLTAVLGEIGNNCFDHNLGHWKDQPGTYFGYGLDKKNFIVCVADRGRGILKSLQAVHPQFTDEQEALDAAFSRKISGRFPEKRGNGLKFDRQAINCEASRGLWCQSGSGKIKFGKLANTAASVGHNSSTVGVGTITVIVWS